MCTVVLISSDPEQCIPLRQMPLNEVNMARLGITPWIENETGEESFDFAEWMHWIPIFFITMAFLVAFIMNLLERNNKNEEEQRQYKDDKLNLHFKRRVGLSLYE